MPNYMRHTHRVMFETQNRCPYSYLHKDCPTDHRAAPVTLPAQIVTDVLDMLGELGWAGRVSFHNYNEPLVDPRLFQFIDYVRAHVPRAQVFIMTCGWSLDAQMMRELVEHGVHWLEISAYRDNMSPIPGDVARLEALRKAASGIGKFSLCAKSELDDRKRTYGSMEHYHKTPCYAPLGTIVIRATGDVVLCCMDWKDQHVFGNLHKETLQDILERGEMNKVYERLSVGNRFLDLCVRCQTARGDTG